jgi:protein-tyrosine-phosphatase
MTEILYVCTGNRFRSMFAEAYTKANQNQINAFSRGTDASQNILKEVKNEMQSRNLWSHASKPEQLENRDLKQGDTAICMKPRHKKIIEEQYTADIETIVWNVDDVPADLPTKKLRSKISSTFDNLEELLKSRQIPGTEPDQK